jgi:hypothetical protein
MRKFASRRCVYMLLTLWVWLSAISVLGCSSVQPHLADDEVNALRSMSTSLIYVEPRISLYTYMRGSSVPGPPVDNSVIQGAELGIGAGIASEIVNEKLMKDYQAFVKEFTPYRDTVKQLPISEMERETARTAMRVVPWFQKGNFSVMQFSNDSDFYHKAVQSTDAQVVIFISPITMLRTDAEVVHIEYRISIYVKDPEDKYDVHRFDSHIISYEEEIYPGNEAQSDRLEDAFDALSMNQRLKDIFSNNGALFIQTMTAMLTTLQTRLRFYFTGVSAHNTSLNPDQR